MLILQSSSLSKVHWDGIFFHPSLCKDQCIACARPNLDVVSSSIILCSVSERCGACIICFLKERRLCIGMAWYGSTRWPCSDIRVRRIEVDFVVLFLHQMVLTTSALNLFNICIDGMVRSVP